MPELPEVETTRRGISPTLEGRTVTGVCVRQHRLRWPVPDDLKSKIMGEKLQRIERIAKYLVFRFDSGNLILHLGMSGSLRVVPIHTPVEKHDHLDILFADTCLRFRDPRRFGAILWTQGNPGEHQLLRHLGPEPLSAGFNAEYLYRITRSRRISIKNLIMDGKVVVGVGNIYANESLFMAGIHPSRPCNRISRQRIGQLVPAIQQILKAAIAQGGTTLQDFQQADGKPGYFTQSLQVYDREGQPCVRCGAMIKQKRIGQRSAYYCAHCQH